MTPATLQDTRTRLRAYPTCEWEQGRQWCRRIAVSVEPTEPGSRFPWATRCPTHRPPGSLRVCLSCSGENASRDDWHCGGCREGDEVRTWAV